MFAVVLPQVLGKSSLSESTIQAEKEEKERKARIAEKQKKVTHFRANIVVSAERSETVCF